MERLQQSHLIGKPVVIGGVSDRGVVASCSYEARAFGVHAGMPIKMARQLCPQANYIRGDMDQYTKYSNLVTDIIADQAPVYEKASIDEHYLDLSGMDRFYGCLKWTEELRFRIIKETGLPISFGLSVNKTVRITSYNVCYTKLLRTRKIYSLRPQKLLLHQLILPLVWVLAPGFQELIPGSSF